MAMLTIEGAVVLVATVLGLVALPWRAPAVQQSWSAFGTVGATAWAVVTGLPGLIARAPKLLEVGLTQAATPAVPVHPTSAELA